MRIIRAVSRPHGFNLGHEPGHIAGGRHRRHLHQHVVPRWPGDPNYMTVIGRHQDPAAAARRHPRPARGGLAALLDGLGLERRQQRLERLLVGSRRTAGASGASSSSVSNIASFIPTRRRQVGAEDRRRVEPADGVHRGRELGGGRRSAPTGCRWPPTAAGRRGGRRPATSRDVAGPQASSAAASGAPKQSEANSAPVLSSSKPDRRRVVEQRRPEAR